MKQCMLILAALAAFATNAARADLLDYSLVADQVFTDSTCSTVLTSATITNNGGTVTLPVGTVSAFVRMAILATVNTPRRSAHQQRWHMSGCVEHRRDRRWWRREAPWATRLPEPGCLALT